MVPLIDAQPAIVLHVEAQWLQATRHHDAHVLATILAPVYVHINYRGQVRNRADELASVGQSKSYVEHTSGQSVDFIHDIAIVHGLNTVTRSKSVIGILRYTDIYEWLNGRWRAIFSQETAVER